MKILAIGAHADDIELGCGGSLLKWSKEGHDITLFVATDSGFSAPDGTIIRGVSEAKIEAEESADRLNANLIIGDEKVFQIREGDFLTSQIRKVVENTEPDMVLTHWDGDVHIDHSKVSSATLHTTRHISSVLMYTSNWYTGSQVFDGRIGVDISSTMDDKLALLKIFQSEYERAGESWRDFVVSQATLNGKIWDCSFAEAFKVVKYLMR